MIAISLGLTAALFWSFHDVLARRFSGDIGPFRLAIWVVLLGAAILAVPVMARARLQSIDTQGLTYALAMGATYAIAIGGLLKAFSIAPISIVGPFTAPYPALVVIWGMFNGLTPGWGEYTAILLILGGAIVVARFGHSDGGLNVVASGQLPTLLLACALACLGFAASVILGQMASATLGSLEATLVSRVPAALLLLPLALPEHHSGTKLKPLLWWAIAAMALCDVIAITVINIMGEMANKEYGAMAITAYGALAVLLATIVLREKVSAGQWLGIALIAVGVGYLGFAGA